VRVKPYQIVVEVSVNLQALMQWDPHMPGFPAILDTGNNHNLSISRRHLLRWAGLQPEALRIIGAIRERQQQIPLHAASVWLHKNRPGERALREQEPHTLNLRDLTWHEERETPIPAGVTDPLALEEGVPRWRS